ncbi:Putative aldehyde dehydrogenase YfmT [Rubripirellula lacrimiformis]|uniref:Aldehyde dehydrogenase YfmT n=1 Tax=Rubripirellula lacrimiformis TaxID=1930273 RepID=A0A517NAH1_9BACT|nr:aldehyde dehydrogenase family protein [Rubripirellula lacrimiformis]QDT04134.1 Putative aldehyde dehydrogenase YfmT [Rubripirellula lacrimiformis]
MKTYQHWIDGQDAGEPDACEPDAGVFDVLNPEDDSVIATAVRGTVDDVARAIAAADAAWATYRKTSPSQREGWLLAAADLLESDGQRLVELLVSEVGSPISKARREIATSAGVLRSAAGTCRRQTGQTIPTDVPGRVSYSVRCPLGVVAGITPFNVPLIKGIKHSAMPLATGNTVVLLPSPQAPGVAIEIARLYHQAGFPLGAFNVVLGYGDQIGDALTGASAVRAVGFTGSNDVGRHIAGRCGASRKRFTLEMGGKNPLIVMDDADLDQAVKAAIAGAFLFQGQICMSSSRILVARSIIDSFTQRLAAAAQGLSLGDLREPSTMIGPIIHERQRSKIRRHVDDAIRRGATLVTGGKWVQNRFQPTVLSNVPADAVIHREETFGPVAVIEPFDAVDQAIDLANSTNFGLTASVFTSSLKTALRCVDEIDAGMVHVNEMTIQEEAHVPFGGNRDSGFGREGSEVGIDTYTEWKWVTIHGLG